MKKISIAVIAASLAIAAGCGSDDSENSSSTEPAIGSLPAGTDGVDTTDEASGKGLDMTLVLGTLGDDFYKAIECGAKLEAEATGVNLDIQAPTAFDASLQIPIVNAIAATDPDAVIIAPNDSDALFEPLKSIVDAGSELVLVDTNLSDTTLAAGHIGSDYLLYGEQGAQEIAKLIGETGKVLAIFAPPASRPTTSVVKASARRWKPSPTSKCSSSSSAAVKPASRPRSSLLYLPPTPTLPASSPSTVVTPPVWSPR